MDLKVVVGKTIRLPAEFFSGERPADPVNPRVEVVDPNGVSVLSDAVPVREGKGIYRYDFPVPPDAPLGTWKTVWTATIDGNRLSGSDPFEVQAPGKADRPPEPGLPAGTPKSDAAGPASAKAAASGPVAPPKPGAGKAPSAPQKPDSRRGPEATRPLESSKAGGRAAEKLPQARPGKAAPDTAPAAKSGKSASTAAPAEVGKGRKKSRKARAETAALATKEVATEPDIWGEDRRGRKARSPETRSRLSPAKALLILGAIAIVLAGIWFSPRREDTVQAKIDQGVAAQKAGRTDEARELYQEVLANDPDNKLANFNLGVAAQLAGQLDEAESYYRRSLTTDPDFLPGLFNLAILLERQNRNDESAELYRMILEKYPDNGPAHLNYGFLLAQKMNQVEEGKAEFRRAVELEPALATRIPAEWRPASPESGQPAP